VTISPQTTTEEITLEDVRQWLLAYAEHIFVDEAYLTELDAAIGDGDHGANMVRGMRKVRDWLEKEGSSSPDIGALLRTVAMMLISTIGGAAGPLYGAFFLRAAKDAMGSQVLTLTQMAALFASGLEGIQQRGKAVVGEKTMIDTLHPGVVALAERAAAGATLYDALHAARQAAEAGMVHTIELEATKGRASYLGPRSVGHQDPGATSAYYLFETAARITENVERRA
jgi:phosphoenolpyruvate---glycerone phosphotransferase subunit DhaL